MFLPVFALLAMVLVWALARLLMRTRMSDKTNQELLNACQRTYFQVIVILYLPLTAMALAFLGCRKGRDGVWCVRACRVAPGHCVDLGCCVVVG